MGSIQIVPPLGDSLLLEALQKPLQVIRDSLIDTAHADSFLELSFNLLPNTIESLSLHVHKKRSLFTMNLEDNCFLTYRSNFNMLMRSSETKRARMSSTAPGSRERR